MKIKHFGDMIEENIMEILRERAYVSPTDVHLCAGHSWNAAKAGLDRLVFKGLIKREVGAPPFK
jgi:hypothetical protein